ncbi:MAG: hypothetical protein M0Z82_08085 [Actinomycetota bacterium]|nr:hypothetical protein [Actinomycetota bacterium]
MRNVAGRWRHAWWIGGLVAMVALLGGVVPAGASTVTNPYSSGSNGYDVAQPNCSETLPTTGGFAIVGLGGGRPFTTNTCLSTEWAWATTHASTSPGPALYFNTGYSGAYGRDVTSAKCGTYEGPTFTKKLSKHDQSTYAQAWEIGCSEAAYAAAVASNGGETPSMWWADIETGNSWSTNQTVNQYAVDGISYGMEKIASSSLGIWGVYSYPSAWDKIVGSGFTAVPPFEGDWGPSVTSLSCGTTGFSGAPVWIVQGGTSSGGVDTDTGCG